MNLFLLQSTASRLQLFIISNYSYHKYLNPFIFLCSKETLREKSLYLEFSGFRRFTLVFSPNAWKYGPEKVRIRYFLRIENHCHYHYEDHYSQYRYWNIKVQITIFTINCVRLVCDAGFRKKLQIKIPRVFKFSRWFKTKFSESLLK